MQKFCPFFNNLCCEDECGIYDTANEKCSFLLVSEIMASRTKGYRAAKITLEPIPVKVVKSDD